MHTPRDHQAGAVRRGRTSARWRAAAVVTAAATLSLAVGAVPASAAGGYTVTATIPARREPRRRRAGGRVSSSVVRPEVGDAQSSYWGVLFTKTILPSRVML
jgi:hypothetical protein